MNVSADALRERFAVHGRFYEATLEGRSFALRSHLELFESHLGWREAVAAEADLVAVMMNPGASRPLAEPDADGWAPAVPDRTQYQLMKLALHAQQRGWALRHIRVLNLSDLRTPKSAALSRRFPCWPTTAIRCSARAGAASFTRLSARPPHRCSGPGACRRS